MYFDYSLLRVPLESLSREFRLAQKAVSSQLLSERGSLASALLCLVFYSLTLPLSEPTKLKIEREVGDVLMLLERMENDEATDAASVISVRERLAGCIERLEATKQRVADASRKEAHYAELCVRRLEHVGTDAEAGDTPAGNPDREYAVDHGEAHETRLSRMVGEQLARDGHLALAARYCREAGVESLVDLELLDDVARISDALLRRHDCEPALAWCVANTSRLRRIDSRLRFELRRQQFVELVREGHRARAMSHAAEFLAPAASGNGNAAQTGGTGSGPTPAPSTTGAPRQQVSAAESPGASTLASSAVDGMADGGMASPALAQLQRDMALLAFPDPVRCGIPQYERLFHEDRWGELKQLFVSEACRAYGLSPISPLVLSLRAGLCAVKTHACRSAPGARRASSPPPAPVTRSSSFSSKFRLRGRSRSQSRDSVDSGVSYGSLESGGDGWEAASACRPPRHRSCPACHTHLLPVASALPPCRRTHSHLICRLSQTVMEGANQPMVMPNGSVYGLRALTAMASTNRGIVTCPRTGEKCHMRELRRAYVL